MGWRSEIRENISILYYLRLMKKVKDWVDQNWEKLWEEDKTKAYQEECIRTLTEDEGLTTFDVTLDRMTAVTEIFQERLGTMFCQYVSLRAKRDDTRRHW